MAEEQLKQLKAKRGVIKASLTRFQKYVRSLDDAERIDFCNLEERLSDIKPLIAKFDDIQTEIETVGGTEVSDIRAEFEDAYYETVARAKKLLSSAQCAPVSRSVGSVDTIHTQIRLPRIELPSFNGNYDQWRPFHDTFNSLIHCNSDIADVQKFHYLKSSLHGDAKDLLQSLEITGENYAIAWKLLEDRFDNKRLIVRNHVKSIRLIQPMNKESHTSLRKIVDTVQINLRALKALKRPVDSWDDILVDIIASKLDHITSKEWETTLTTKEPPSLQQMLDFLIHRCEILESVCKKTTEHTVSTSTKAIISRSASHLVTTNRQCIMCNNDHSLQQCNSFLNKSVAERIDAVKARKLCLNCLKHGHPTFRCFSAKCKQCGKRHHALLHATQPASNNGPDIKATGSQAAIAQQRVATPDAVPSTSHCFYSSVSAHTLLPTAMLQVEDEKGNKHMCRALLDSGSQVSFITHDMVNRIKLPRRQISYSITGINQYASLINSMVQANIVSVFNNYRASVDLLVTNKITEHLPAVNMQFDLAYLPKNIKLADPKFFMPSQVDILLGADIFWDLLCVGRIKLSSSQLSLHKTLLGWIVSGKIGLQFPVKSRACNFVRSATIDENLKKFWELEECFPQISQTAEERACEMHFAQTMGRSNDGRFIVRLPFKNEFTKIGETRKMAVKRLYSIERKFARQPQLKAEYVKFMDEYLSLGHMKLAPDEYSDDCYYLPHHAVIKEHSQTTKLRVVFDGSAKSSSGVSLNDILMVGPTVQNDLFTIVMRFRTHRFVITADIAKMYRQIALDARDTRYHRILWRSDSSQPVRTYELTTVTYGTAPASFLATRCLQQLAFDAKDTHPLGSTTILNGFYVDDLLTGANTKQELIKIRNEVIEILRHGQFQLRKWASNDPELLSGMDFSSENSVLDFSNDATIKTLGLQWNSHKDILQYSIPETTVNRKVTKRSILSDVSRIFDPLGLINPIVVKAKILIQKLWQMKLQWDESLPTDLHTMWIKYREELSQLNLLNIPRNVMQNSNARHVQLHGFSDASEAAYGACVYVRVTNEDNTYATNLLAAKSRVAPIKAVSLPRLELCGAVLLSRLVDQICKSMDFNKKSVYYWTDSTVSLSWIKAESKTWNTFVSNRVGEIQRLSDVNNWRHIRTQENPADVISRGATPKELINLRKWWHGPDWLNQDENKWPEYAITANDHQINEERRKTSRTTAMVIAAEQMIDYERFSSFSKLLRVVAYVQRFTKRCRKDHSNAYSTIITSAELNSALKPIIKDVQAQSFAEDLKTLRKTGTVTHKSGILCLSPFLDADGIIRVGGRLRNAKLSYAAKHQILLPAKHHLTRLIIRSEHITHLHTGVEGTLAAVRRRFWPLSARNLIRKIIRECVTCFRAAPRSSQQIMADLPISRLSQVKPFTICGVDYFGPLQVREHRRKAAPTKAYGAIFICFATKAVHCELVSSLSTEAFISAFKRFLARRGNVSHIYSDNGTNFVGANRELKEMRKMFESDYHKTLLMQAFTDRQINWHFIPPNSPHFGGLWEAGVKSFKTHLRRVAGNSVLNYEEMLTLLIQIEAVLNSRPLTSLSNDPNDLAVLTPAHFLVGDSLVALPEPILLDTTTNRLSRWQMVTKLQQHFWKRWSREYLTRLQQRTRWKSERGVQPAVGQLVLLQDENLPPLKWAMGRIVELHPGADGIVRALTIRTSKGLTKRATSRTCALPPES